MKKKGFTLTELMVSVAMIAIIMIFLVKLLVDIKYDVINSEYNTANQFNRAEIIKMVQNDLKEKTLVEVTYPSNEAKDKKTIIFKTSDSKESNLMVSRSGNDYIIVYKSLDGNQKKWTIKKNNSNNFVATDVDNGDLTNNGIKYTGITFNCTSNTITEQSEEDSTQIEIKYQYLIQINIPLYVGTTKKVYDNSQLQVQEVYQDNKMDDFTFSFYGIADSNDVDVENGNICTKLDPTSN